MCVPEDYLCISLLFLVFDAANVTSENAGALESDIESDIETRFQTCASTLSYKITPGSNR